MVWDGTVWLLMFGEVRSGLAVDPVWYALVGFGVLCCGSSGAGRNGSYQPIPVGLVRVRLSDVQRP